MLLGVFTGLWGLGLSILHLGVLMSGQVMTDWVEVVGHCEELLFVCRLGCREPLLPGMFTGLWVLGLFVLHLGVLMFGQEEVL